MSNSTFLNELAAMDPTELALGAGLIGIILTLMLIGAVLWYFISAIGYYKMYQKAGEKGWKAFIPYYKNYIRFKIAWEPKYFWLFLVGLVVMQVLSSSEKIVPLLICLVAAIVAVTIGIKLDIRIAKSFGKSTGWGVLLFFFSFIVSLILGFGKSEYIGNTTEKEEKEL